MSATTMSLEHELTKEQVLEAWKKDVSQQRTPWRYRLGSCAAVFLAIHHWGNVPWWITGMEIGFVMSFWWMPRLVMWAVTRFAFQSRTSLPCLIEIDNHGLSFHSPSSRSAPSRFDWSYLSRIEETDFGIELQFTKKLHGAMIPWHAFTDDEQRQKFVELVNHHMDKSHSIAQN